MILNFSLIRSQRILWELHLIFIFKKRMYRRICPFQHGFSHGSRMLVLLDSNNKEQANDARGWSILKLIRSLARQATTLKCAIFAHLGAPSYHDCSVQSGRQVGVKKKGRKKKKSSISHNGVSGSIPPRSNDRQRKSSGARRISLVHTSPIARRFVARARKKYDRKPKITIFASAAANRRHLSARPSSVEPNPGLLFRRQWSAKPIGRTLTIAAAIDSNQRSPWNQWIRGIMAARAIVWNWVFPKRRRFSPTIIARVILRPLHQLTRLRRGSDFDVARLLDWKEKKNLQNVRKYCDHQFLTLSLSSWLVCTRQERKYFDFVKLNKVNNAIKSI